MAKVSIENNRQYQDDQNEQQSLKPRFHLEG
jgi:hypothetical protein